MTINFWVKNIESESQELSENTIFKEKLCFTEKTLKKYTQKYR